MSKYYLDFVGLNTFIYEPVGYDADNQYYIDDSFGTHASAEKVDGINFSDISYVAQNTFGGFTTYVLNNIQSLGAYKNHLFSHNLPNRDNPAHATASFFPALMLHRNGPYGWPAWKSMRLGKNPLTRKQRKNNIISSVGVGSPRTYWLQGQQYTVFDRYGKLSNYDEPCVISNKPVVIKQRFPIKGGMAHKIIPMKASFNNEIEYFCNDELNYNYSIIEDDRSADYEGKISLYTDISAPDASLIQGNNTFHSLTYRQTVFPPEKYTYKSYMRQRTNFFFQWRTSLANRQVTRASDGFSLTGSTRFPTRSVWPLDVDPDWASIGVNGGMGKKRLFHLGYTSGSVQSSGGGINWATRRTNTSSWGILWNPYSQVADTLSDIGKDGTPSGKSEHSPNSIVRPAPYYSRRHGLSWSGSFANPTGMTKIFNQFTGSSLALKAVSSDALFGGEAYWDAPKQRGRGPFHDKYDNAVGSVRAIGKDYSIIPEFKISSFVPFYLTNSVGVPIESFLELTGGNSSFNISSQSKFYEVYSTSDLMKNFDIIVDDHDGLADPVEIKIKCNVISKFIPYDGFYPVQRSVELASQFYKSYRPYTNTNIEYQITGAFWQGTQTLNTQDAQFGFQALMSPMFAPGVLFNSIKSGIAVDFPILTGSEGVGSHITTARDSHANRQYAISKNNFDVRIPFEAIINPHRYLSKETLVTTEPHPSGALTASCFWEGGGNDLYVKMANNFLAEIPNFFLNDRKNTYISSLPEKHPNFGFLEKGKTYGMRIKMRRSMEGVKKVFTDKSTITSYSRHKFKVPQDVPNNHTRRESITMYSRPSAFGPPSMGVNDFGSTNVHIEETHGMMKHTAAQIHTPGLGSDQENWYQLDSLTGYNFPYTPPYYHGEAWMDITVKNDDDLSGKFTLDEIWGKINSVKQYRFSSLPYYLSGAALQTLGGRGPQAFEDNRINKNAVQLTSSLNIFSKGVVNQPFDDTQENNRWIIQTKFETPILNFNKYQESDNLTLPSGEAKYGVPRGMWHQYGDIPTGNEGIFIEVTDIPNSWSVVNNGMTRQQAALTRSLADVVGFNSDPVKLGSLPQSKLFREAVVVIPFTETQDGKQFFKLDSQMATGKELVRVAKQIVAGEFQQTPEGSTRIIDELTDTVTTMVREMQRFVIPPQMDFVRYPDTIDPFAMYVFPFTFSFSKEDLKDIWQGIMPEKAHNKISREISHKLNLQEPLSQDVLKDNPIRWMVFKVKQRANVKYKDTLYEFRGEELSQNFSGGGSSLNPVPFGGDREISYNWPYDFFSMIELVKIDTDIKFKESKEHQRARENMERIAQDSITRGPGGGMSDIENLFD